MKKAFISICAALCLILAGCYGVNSETSEIGRINSTCQSKDAWAKITQEYSVNKIKDSVFMDGLKDVKNHFITPDYILYFEDSPKEIVGCDYYSIRVAFNPKIFNGSITGLTPSLSDKEQVRIRNRVLKLLYKYECPQGKKVLLDEMSKPAVFGKEYYENK